MHLHSLLTVAIALFNISVIAGTTSDGRCGSYNGLSCQQIKWDSCCSKWGYCGSTSEHCDVSAGCDTRFGSCNEDDDTSHLGESSTTSPDGSCGGEFGYTCEGNKGGQCCSLYGWCGRTDLYCGKGCQESFGICNELSTHPNPSPKPSTSTDEQPSINGQCGTLNGKTCDGYPYGKCCSQYGWCGNGLEYCGDGCDSKYGKCKGETSSAKAVPKSFSKPSSVKLASSSLEFSIASSTMSSASTVSKSSASKSNMKAESSVGQAISSKAADVSSVKASAKSNESHWSSVNSSFNTSDPASASPASSTKPSNVPNSSIPLSSMQSMDSSTRSSSVPKFTVQSSIKQSSSMSTSAKSFSVISPSSNSLSQSSSRISSAQSSNVVKSSVQSSIKQSMPNISSSKSEDSAISSSLSSLAKSSSAAGSLSSSSLLNSPSKSSSHQASISPSVSPSGKAIGSSPSISPSILASASSSRSALPSPSSFFNRPCGGYNNAAVCGGDAPCCSGVGYCGSGTDYCSAATQCQPAFSAPRACAQAETTRVCGTYYGGATCNGFPGGSCCSGAGFCGTGSDYCSATTGCQPSFSAPGACAASNSEATRACGKLVGNAKCDGFPGGTCCSGAGFCGSGSDYCSAQTGCQPAFSGPGVCQVPPETTRGCGKYYNGATCNGFEGGGCCSGVGFCGSGSDYCSTQTQCQPAFSVSGTCEGTESIRGCGTGYGGATCNGFPGGGCCSGAGFCGKGSDYCSVQTRCQPPYSAQGACE